jgi:dienelactone hydrolase
MSDEVVTSINEAIKKISNGKSFSLIGYSGGGGIAVLIASRNENVRDILTIAANLDHVTFNNYHHVKSMSSSLNPIDYASKISGISQLHISGDEDKIVPSFITEKYVKKSSSDCVKHRVFSGVKHNEGWEKHWKQILDIPLIYCK